MKIAVLTDVHGNLPALQIAMRAIRRERCDAVFHTGDAIGIGPFPAEPGTAHEHASHAFDLR